MLTISKDKLLELLFLTGLSIVIFVVFYCLLSIGGAVIGNDGSVHFGRAQEFLSTGRISLDNLGWTPPLYQILLAFLFALTGITNIEQLLVIVKISAIAVNWLLFFSMYLLVRRVFNKKIAMVAVSLLLLCFPMFELNMWGGYTSVLGIAFMLLLFSYLPLSVEHKSYMVVVGVFSFALVLSHQLTLFVSALILMPVLLFLIIKSRGKGIKALIFLIIGGGVSFFLYYVRAMLPYLGDLIGHIFFEQKAMAYQIPQTSLSAFWLNFGFVLLFGAAGFVVVTYKLWREKKHVSNLILILSFVVPLVLAKSYLFGLYLPFHWFVYYVMPPMAIFAAVFLFFIVDKSQSYYKVHKSHIKRVYVNVVVVGLIILSCSAIVIQGSALGSQVNSVIPYFATSDAQSLQVGQWLKTNYPEPVTVVVTETPGFWFTAFCEKDVIVEINQAVERNVISESVLALSYEVETPLTLLRAYEAKGDITSEYYVSVNDVWLLGTFCSIAGDYVSYNDVNGVYKEVPLRQMARYYLWDSSQTAHKLTFIYENDDITVSQSQLIQSSSYSTQVFWDITPAKASVSNVTLYTSSFFHLYFNFDKAYLPGVLNWENPWTNPTDIYNGEWAVTSFSKNSLTDDYIAVRDAQNRVYYAMKFHDLPDWGNMGALGNNQIDAIRLSYTFEQINAGKPASFSYQTLIFSEERYHQTIQPSQLKDLFTVQPEYFTVTSRDYLHLIEENNIGFIVYDKNKLDPNIVRCGILDLVYSTDRYAVFRVNR